MKGKITIISAMILIVATAFCLFACNPQGDAPVAIDYQANNAFFVKTTESETALTFEPILDPVYSENGMTYKKVDYRYGMVFYAGTATDAKSYEYLGNALAKQGYLVIINKERFAHSNYAATENAFSQYPDVRFFVAGHEQGGGAAIHRASENQNTVAGAILLSPVAYQHALLDENNNPVKDENGVEIHIKDTLENTSLPVLLINGDLNKVLSNDVIEDVKSRLPRTFVDKVVENGTHTGFAQIDNEEDLPVKLPNFQADFNATDLSQKQNQRNKTVEYVLDFLKGLSK